MSMPLISVVTSTYQQFEKIYETIGSVLLQDYPRIEYIICDDGSDHFPEQQINEFIEKNKRNNIVTVKITHSPHNRGTVRNFNDAYRKCTGKYFFVLHAGDVFFSVDTLSKLVSRFMETNCKVLAASRILYHDNYQPVCLLPHYKEREIIKKYDSSKEQYAALVAYRYFDMASGCAMYFSREVMEEFNYFDENYVRWEDGPFLAKYLYKYKLEFAHDIISIWYEDGGVSPKRFPVKPRSINPVLWKDSLLFNETERIAHLDELKRSDRRRILYINQWATAKSTKDKIMTHLAFFPDGVSYAGMIIKRRLRAMRDKYYINKILNESDKDSLIGYKK